MPLWYGKPVDGAGRPYPPCGNPLAYVEGVPNWARLLLVVRIKVHSRDAVAGAKMGCAPWRS